MNDGYSVDMWALQKADAIVKREGLTLADAAQWLDRKRTRESLSQLRSAIAASLLEASRKVAV